MDDFARVLSVRVAALASAAESSGVPSEAIGRLLEAASVAAARAVALELLAEPAAAGADAELRDAA